MKKRLGPVERLYPMPCPLVVSGTLEKPGALAVAWINIVASTPPTIAMGLRESRNTLALIRESGSFTVNVPPASLASQVDFFGLTSGRQTDKFRATGLTLEPSSLIGAPMIAECPFNLECRVTEEVVIGSYRLVLGEVVEAHAEESVLLSADDTLIDVEKLDPLIYIAGTREYRRIGEKVSNAYISKDLFGNSD